MALTEIERKTIFFAKHTDFLILSLVDAVCTHDCVAFAKARQSQLNEVGTIILRTEIGTKLSSRRNNHNSFYANS